MKQKDYLEIYNEKWKEIVEDENGNLDKDKVARELADYSFMLDQVPNVYCEITDSQLSKPNYYASVVLRVFHSIYIHKGYAYDDILDYFQGALSGEDKEWLKNYFDQ